MRAAIIVDSTAGLSIETAKTPNIFQLYLSTIFEDGTIYVDTADENLTRDFYERMDTEQVLPKTSQPEPKQVYDLFDRIIAEGYDTVFGLFISERISGTYQTVYAVAQEYANRLDIHLIDTRLTSFVMEAMCLNLLELIRNRKQPDAIKSRIKDLIQQSAFYFTPAKLDNLVKGGRLSSVGGLVGNLLNIKPIITMGTDTKGEVIVAEKVRSSKRALNRLYEIAEEHIKLYPHHAYVVIGHAGAPQDAAALADRIQAAFPECHLRVGYISPVLGTHGGSGAVSINVAPLLNPEG